MKRSTFIFLILLLLAAVVVFDLILLNKTEKNDLSAANKILPSKKDSIGEWLAPDINSIPLDENGMLIKYGRDLIANTSKYLGPKGTVAHITNGMNCQNCHLEAGSKSFGNSFATVSSSYPMFRPRSGIVETIEFRVNDCLQRSLNGKPLDTTGREMRAIVAYVKWIGKDVSSKQRPKGTGIAEVSFIDRMADTARGRVVYTKTCATCHGAEGNGFYNKDSTGYSYPPLWGKHSYNTGAGLYRLTRFAAYVKNNMPFGRASVKKPFLTDEEAWDVAAFVNSQPRPVKTFEKDWPDITKKAIDFPYGPYADTFSTTQHKYGPFAPIDKARKEMAKR